MQRWVKPMFPMLYTSAKDLYQSHIFQAMAALRWLSLVGKCVNSVTFV